MIFTVTRQWALDMVRCNEFSGKNPARNFTNEDLADVLNEVMLMPDSPYKFIVKGD
jgi:hypothetical protein